MKLLLITIIVNYKRICDNENKKLNSDFISNVYRICIEYISI